MGGEMSIAARCPRCGKRYRVSRETSRKIRCRECQTTLVVDVDEVVEEPALPELPAVARKKLNRREAADDAAPTGKKRRSAAPKSGSVTAWLAVAIIQLVIWAVLGVLIVIPELRRYGLSGLVINGLVLSSWGVGGIAIIAGEDNEWHGLLCWSTFLLVLAPFVGCVAMISVVGLMMVLYYGLARLPRTGLYVLNIVLGIGMMALVGSLDP